MALPKIKALPHGSTRTHAVHTKLQAWINDWVAKNNENGNLTAIYKRFHG